MTAQHLRGAAFRQRSGPFASGATSLKNLRSIGSLFAQIVMIHHYFLGCDRKMIDAGLAEDAPMTAVCKK
ncbi:hypothetical protein P2A95_11300 [Xanthomonas perforans]